MTAPTQLPPGAEDEFDVTFAEIRERARGDGKALVRKLSAREQVPEYLIDEVTHLTRFGYRDPDGLAALMGVSRNAIDKQIPYGVVRPIGPSDQRFAEVLEQVIASGRRFTTEALPLPDDDQFAVRELTLAVKAGRLRKVGSDKSSSNKVTIWEPISTPTERLDP